MWPQNASKMGAASVTCCSFFLTGSNCKGLSRIYECRVDINCMGKLIWYARQQQPEVILMNWENTATNISIQQRVDQSNNQHITQYAGHSKGFSERWSSKDTHSWHYAVDYCDSNRPVNLTNRSWKDTILSPCQINHVFILEPDGRVRGWRNLPEYLDPAVQIVGSFVMGIEYVPLKFTVKL